MPNTLFLQVSTVLQDTKVGRNGIKLISCLFLANPERSTD